MWTQESSSLEEGANGEWEAQDVLISAAIMVEDSERTHADVEQICGVQSYMCVESLNAQFGQHSHAPNNRHNRNVAQDAIRESSDASVVDT